MRKIKAIVLKNLLSDPLKRFSSFFLLTVTAFASIEALAQATESVSARSLTPPPISKTFINRYIDQKGGKTADELVTYALENNPEIGGLRKQVEASRAMVEQAGLRANPAFEIGGAKNVATPSKRFSLSGSLPLELNGRRQARVLVAEVESEIQKQILADRERTLAAQIRSKFGETLAKAASLQFIEETLEITTENFQLVAARVEEGRTAPLEKSMEMVELNRIRAMRETGEGELEVTLLELKNLAGMPPDASLRLRGELYEPPEPSLLLETLMERGIRGRPDLQIARLGVRLFDARIKRSKSQGSIDASLRAGFDRMRQGFPQFGFDEFGQPARVQELANVVSFGVTLSIPVFDRKQGEIAATELEKNAAEKRLELAELSVKSEIAASFARYMRAAKAMEIYRVGVDRISAENLLVVRQTYEFGARDLLDYIAEQRRYIEIKQDFIDAQLERYLSWVNILQSAALPELTRK